MIRKMARAAKKIVNFDLEEEEKNYYPRKEEKSEQKKGRPR